LIATEFIMIVIQTSHLSRKFNDVMAVEDLNLEINEGEIFGLLGPNASGKSTTIRMLAGIIQPSGGSARILGMHLGKQTEQIKPDIGYVAQHFSLYSDLTVSENLEFYAGLYRVDNAQTLHKQLSRFELHRYAKSIAGHLSGGYQRRLAIACATVHNPKVIFLDEPTAGIDPVTRKDLWDLFYELVSDRKTLFVTTHYMEEAKRCNRLGFLSQGKLITSGQPDEILASLDNYRVYSAELPYHPATNRKIVAATGVILVNQFGNELRIVTDHRTSQENLESVISAGIDTKLKLEQVAPGIEDAFMVLTQDDGKKCS